LGVPLKTWELDTRGGVSADRITAILKLKYIENIHSGGGYGCRAVRW
jgi:hypothetical protein